MCLFSVQYVSLSILYHKMIQNVQRQCLCLAPLLLENTTTQTNTLHLQPQPSSKTLSVRVQKLFYSLLQQLDYILLNNIHQSKCVLLLSKVLVWTISQQFHITLVIDISTRRKQGARCGDKHLKTQIASAHASKVYLCSNTLVYVSCSIFTLSLKGISSTSLIL